MKRELMTPHKGDKRYVRRDDQGHPLARGLDDAGRGICVRGLADQHPGNRNPRRNWNS